MAEKDTTKKVVAKKPATKTAAKAPAKKPVAKVAKKQQPVAEEVKPVATTEPIAEVTVATTADTAPVILTKPTIDGGRYVFATGRRKTSIANLRLFSGEGKIEVNHKPLNDYFFHATQQDQILQPLMLTGLKGDFYFTVSVSGGGINAQARAVQHGLAQSLGSLGADIRIIMKKNGFLTRDDRKKERKKPGLRRARRAPQWAKR
jgi:small subunit ribosomal protein S9